MPATTLDIEAARILAKTDMNADAHDNRVTRIPSRIGEAGTIVEIIALLDTPRA